MFLSSDSLSVIRWWVDASFSVYDNYCEHTGATMLLGVGSIGSISGGQNINSRSSTEVDITGANDMLPQVLWRRYFTKAKRYAIKDVIVHQYNVSGISIGE